MNQMEEALYRAGAHIVFKEEKPNKEEPLPLRKWKVPVAPGGKASLLRRQRVIGGIPRDPVNRQAAIVTAKSPKQ